MILDLRYVHNVYFSLRIFSGKFKALFHTSALRNYMPTSSKTHARFDPNAEIRKERNSENGTQEDLLLRSLAPRCIFFFGALIHVRRTPHKVEYPTFLTQHI